MSDCENVVYYILRVSWTDNNAAYNGYVGASNVVPGVQFCSCVLFCRAARQRRPIESQARQCDLPYKSP
jgi:hypothetical protein